MTDYIEVTTISSTRLQFYDNDTGRTIECICPIKIPSRRGSNLGELEMYYKDCKIHGWTDETKSKIR